MTDLSPGARVGIALVALAAAVLSFSSLSSLAYATGSTAEVAGFRVAWLLPVAVDAAAGVATFIWLRAQRDEVITLARRLAWSTIGLSVIGNGVQHAYASAGLQPGWPIAIAVGAVAPAVFGAVVHLAVTATKVLEQSTGADETGTIPPPASSSVPPFPASSPLPPPDRNEQEEAPGLREDPTGTEAADEEPPPELTGRKIEDAKAWYLHERRHGRTPLPVEVNSRIGSSGYVKTRHLEGWEGEYARERRLSLVGG